MKHHILAWAAALVLTFSAYTNTLAATWDQATAQVQAKYGWNDQTSRYSVDYFGEHSDNVNPDIYVDVFTSPDSAPQWLSGFKNELPQLTNSALVWAEQAYNKLTGTGFIPGRQYVQANGDGSFTTVVTFGNLTAAQNGYNAITYGGMVFVPGARYVQNDYDGTYRVVVRFPLDY